jgi:predicted 3-demethylubiquinone-9 3-methyltransferase (glyoxalase superfamily)
MWCCWPRSQDHAQKTRSGVRVLPDRVAANWPADQLLPAIGNRPPARALEVLHGIRVRYGKRTVDFVAMQLEYPGQPGCSSLIGLNSYKGDLMTPKNTICLWFNKDAHDAARFYAATFPNSKVTAVHKAPGDYPGGKKGDELTVEFTVAGIPCIGLNGGPEFPHSEAFSFQIATDNQEETDRYWNAIVGNGGKESQCGWCKDRWGLNWQITPRVLTEAMAAGGAEAKRAFEAMMPMKKIDVAKIEAARRG